MKNNGMRTPLGRARGLGSAKEGVNHWWSQRVTAVALVPLTLWFVIALLAHLGADRQHAVAWIGSPVPAVLTILLLGTTFYHAMLGLQVVVEDYVNGEAAKIATLLLLRMACFLLAVLGIFAVLSMAFRG